VVLGGDAPPYRYRRSKIPGDPSAESGLGQASLLRRRFDDEVLVLRNGGQLSSNGEGEPYIRIPGGRLPRGSQ
jgi:hypothetical protein